MHIDRKRADVTSSHSQSLDYHTLAVTMQRAKYYKSTFLKFKIENRTDFTYYY